MFVEIVIYGGRRLVWWYEASLSVEKINPMGFGAQFDLTMTATYSKLKKGVVRLSIYCNPITVHAGPTWNINYFLFVEMIQCHNIILLFLFF